MGNYLYNGICLPALPAYDFTAYPNAYIFRKKEGPEYLLVVTAANPVYGEIYDIVNRTGTICVWQSGETKTYTPSGEVWLPKSEGNFLTMCKKADGVIIWSNIDIPLQYRMSQGITGNYLTASEPLPALPRSSFKLGLAFGLCGKPLSYVKGGGVGE